MVRGGAIATTTNVVDTGNGSNQAFNEAKLAIQFTASSTTAILGWRYEYSMGSPVGADCTVNQGACDWYSNNVGTSAIVASSTDFMDRTLTQNVPFTQDWQYGSTTDFCGDTTATIANSGDRRCKMFDVPVLARYMRVVFYLTPGSTQNGAVWSEWLTKKEI